MVPNVPWFLPQGVLTILGHDQDSMSGEWRTWRNLMPDAESFQKLDDVQVVNYEDVAEAHWTLVNAGLKRVTMVRTKETTKEPCKASNALKRRRP
jgi:hypothetical protein